MTSSRPHRQRKADRLISPGSTSAEIACDFALAPFDRAALDSERRWGVDRLPELVSPELAAKYGAAIAFLNDRINAGDADGVASAATNCIRGIAAMDAEALARGHQPVPPEVWIFDEDIDGKRVRFGVTRDGSSWPVLQQSHPGMTIHSLREVAVAVSGYSPVLDAAKAAFPGATITASRPLTDTEKAIGDEIPW